MSNRRAAMRRDQRTREKLLKSKAPGQVCHFQIFLGNLKKHLSKRVVYMVS